MLNEQVGQMRKYVDQRAERAAEITSQLGFPTPYFAMPLGLHPGHFKFTGELVAVTQVMAAHTAMIVKNALSVPRPDYVSAKILPMIATPGHGSYPSAHATESFAVAEVLKAILETAGDAHADRENRIDLVYKQAERIAVNRTVAGVHYPIDTWAGATLGRIVGRLILRLCGQGGEVGDRHYTPEEHDFFVNDFIEAFDTPSADVPINTHGEGSSVAPTPHFTWLWGKMVGEFA
ncbi:MAG TPA: phosphatase PAP2 family protein [Afifellaceae bacterium]|nr:phosphatase PAP2 family protein [Afifellaceae bacterium]